MSTISNTLIRCIASSLGEGILPRVYLRYTFSGWRYFITAGILNINIANLSNKRDVVGLHGLIGLVKVVSSYKVHERITFSIKNTVDKETEQSLAV